jgi:hypothetical protein
MDVNQARELEILTIQRIMSVKDYRAFLSRVIKSSGVLRDSFNEDPATLAYCTGRASMGRWLLREMKSASPSGVLQMIEENFLDD